MGFLKIAADKLGSYLRDELVMVGQVGAAVHAAVAAVARVQVGLERLGFRQLHHDCGGGDRIVRVGVFGVGFAEETNHSRSNHLQEFMRLS